MQRESHRSFVHEGTKLGAYRMLGQIGQGGMGEVWLAEHSLLGRRAAIKVLRPAISASEEMVGRFFNEARAAAAISDPGIVQIFDFGHHTDGSAYIVMELLDGEPLDKRLQRTGVMKLPEALRAMRQVASSLGAAHARKIIHRDLKPENVFLVRDAEVAGGERAKILDFGIAKLAGDPFALKTQTAAIIGTPMYMSPEQCRGNGQIDERSDVYSMGCLLFTLLAGRPPFVGAGLGDVIAMHLCEPPPHLSMFAPGIPREIDELILRCLAKAPDERFANGTEVARAIDALIARASAAAFARTAAAPPVRVSAPVPVTIAASMAPGMPVNARLAPTAAPGMNAGMIQPGFVPAGSPASMHPGWLPTVAPASVHAPASIHPGMVATVAPASMHPGWLPTVMPVNAPAAAIDPASMRANTTLSASVVAMATPPRRGFDMRIAVVGGVALIGGIVAFAIVRSGSSSQLEAAAPAAPVAPPPVAAPAPAPAKPAHDDQWWPTTRANRQLAAVLAGFHRWAPSHATDACPDHGELASSVAEGLVDPWGHPLVVTCVDQPADQTIGVISLGPDGVAGTRDDLASWNLGADVTELVRGGRWKPQPVRTVRQPPRIAKPPVVKPATPPEPPRGRTFHGTSLGSDGIPTNR